MRNVGEKNGGKTTPVVCQVASPLTSWPPLRQEMSRKNMLIRQSWAWSVECEHFCFPKTMLIRGS